MKARPRHALGTISATLAIASAAVASDTLPAFPGAVGQGATAAGGRGGVVYHVTTLEDYAPKQGEPKIEGSLRHALRAEIGPRTVVFDVAGVIWLKEPLELRKDRVTVAGQTSPGGVTLFGYPFEVSGAKDVVVRHLRVRCSDLHARPEGEVAGASGASRGDLNASSANAIHVGHGAERVILDHVSATWGIDETLSVTRARDVTIQHCLIAEALNDSLHSKGAHGYGSLVRGELTAADQQAGRGGYTFFGNLWAHNRARNPSIGGSQFLRRGEPEAARLRTDVNLVNNVVYDWGSQATHRSNLGAVRVNLIGSYYITGPAKRAKYFFRGGGGDPSNPERPSPTGIYQRGNYFDRDQDAAHDGEPVKSPEGVERCFARLDDDDRVESERGPFGFWDATTSEATASAPDAYNRVVASVGAGLWRDAIDERIIRTLTDRGGRIVDSQEEFRDDEGVLAGVDDAPVRRRPEDFDRDRDGMADDFERTHDLDPDDPDDAWGEECAERLGLPSFTNLEAYLHSLTVAPDAGRTRALRTEAATATTTGSEP